MAAVKKLNTNYTIDTSDVFITGNLNVAGVYNTTTVTNTNVQDRDITLNVGEELWGVGGNASPTTSGLNIDRGLQANVAIRWNESTDVWELTTDGSSYSTILTSGGGGGLTEIVQDTTPQLGGNLETNGFYVQFDQDMPVPSTVSGKTLLIGNVVAGGGSGLYAMSNETPNLADELVTKTKAIVFSLIL